MSKQTSLSVPFVWRSAILFLALLMNVTLAYRLVRGDQSISVWRDLKSVQARLAVEMAALDKQRADLSREIRLLKTDDAYVEKVIRQRLNYVRKNEILYLFDDGKPEDATWTGDGSHGRAE